MSPRDSIRGHWYALTPAVVALALGLWGIGTPGPWQDEMFTIEAISDGLFSHLWDAPMFPYYVVMWLWSGGGHWIDEGWLRLPSVLAVVAGAFLVAVTARRLTTARAGLVAGMIFAMAPGVSRYAQEARTYALAAALVAGATLVLVTAMSGDRRRPWVSYGVLMGLAVLLLPVTFAVLPAHAVILTAFDGWRGRLRDWLTVCLFLTPIAALEAGLAVSFGFTRDWLEKPGLANIPEALTMLTKSEYAGAPGSAYALAVVVLAAVSPVGLRWLAGCLVAAGSIWLLSVVAGSFWTARSLLPLAALLCVGAGVSLAAADWPRILMILGILAIVSLPVHRSAREPGARGVDPTQVAALIDEHGLPGDAVLEPPPRGFAWWGVSHYLRDDPRFRKVDVVGPGRTWVLSPGPECPEFEEWKVVGGRSLRLCL